MAETGSRWPYIQPAWVFSRRALPVIAGADVRFVNGEVRRFYPDIRAAAGDKNIWLVGGGDLAGQFYDAGLLHELIVHIGAVILGSGKPLLPRRLLHPVLRLVSVRQVDATMVELCYEIASTARLNICGEI